MKKKDDGVIIIDNMQGSHVFDVKDHERKTYVIFLIDSKGSIDGEVKIFINGSHSYVKILGIIIGSGNQTIRLYTLQDHKVEQSISDLFIKSIMFDRAKFRYEGLIKIENNAQHSNAYQKNQNLLMSPSSWAESKPYLEILANDVRCTHGATVGKIPQDQLYYLRTRGLTESSAKRLIMEGFANDVLDRIENKSIRRRLLESVHKKLSSVIL